MKIELSNAEISFLAECLADENNIDGETRKVISRICCRAQKKLIKKMEKETILSGLLDGTADRRNIIIGNSKDESECI